MSYSLVDLPKRINTQKLHQCVEDSIRAFLIQIDGTEITNLYAAVVAEIEAPLLRVVMEKVRRNQTQAAKILGINRSTLKKKLMTHCI